MVRKWIAAVSLAALSAAAGVAAVARSGESPPLVSTGRMVEFAGACDTSGAVTLDRDRFVMADDEDNVLRVYDAEGGVPLMTRDLSRALELTPGKKRFPETDIESATALAGVSLWLTSHGRTSKAKPAPSRQIFFATRNAAKGSVELVGDPYTRLLQDLLDEPSLVAFGLGDAAERAPKSPGGLNIEGMTAMEDGRSVLIGLRNPVPGGKALLIPLRNPVALMSGERPRFGSPIRLDLGGLGVRSISWWRGRYLLIGGSPLDGGTSRLFSWSGKPDDPPRAEPVDLTGFNAEAFASFEEREAFLVLSDDGGRLVDGSECKKLKDPRLKRFRGLWVTRQKSR